MASKSGLKFSEQTVEAQRVSYFFIFITPRDMLETELHRLQKDQSMLPFLWPGASTNFFWPVKFIQPLENNLSNEIFDFAAIWSKRQNMLRIGSSIRVPRLRRLRRCWHQPASLLAPSLGKTHTTLGQARL